MYHTAGSARHRQKMVSSNLTSWLLFKDFNSDEKSKEDTLLQVLEMSTYMCWLAILVPQTTGGATLMKKYGY
jgi:hypothetical protein